MLLRRMGLLLAVLASATNAVPTDAEKRQLLSGVIGGLTGQTNPVTKTPKYCPLPGPGEKFGTATPAEVNLDPVAVAKAVLYATTHLRLSLQIFRNGCLITTGPLDVATDLVTTHVWSCTKSVVSLLTGIAIDQGKLKLTDSIDKYLPTTPGWGDAAHRKLTIQQLLTETAGLREAIIADASTVIVESSAPQEALQQPFTHTPGSFFEYAQRVPDLLAYVVGRAVGMDLQDYAQKYLFGPIGIPQNSWFWLRDRSGNTYGYAWLFIPPKYLARLGLLAQYGGQYNSKRIVSANWVKAVGTPSSKNPCYGLLFWNNAGNTCTGANIPSAQTLQRRAIPSAPTDLFMMVGAFHQNNFMIPSLNMTVTWTGMLGDITLNSGALLSAAAGPLYNNFFYLLMKAVKDKAVPAGGFLAQDPLNLDFTPTNYFDPAILLSNIAGSPACNILFCNGGIPTKGLIQNLQSIAGARRIQT